jgi:hypothetical protein
MLDARVQVFFVFANDDHVHLRMPRTYKGGIGDTGADIGKEPEALADGDVQALEPATLWGCDWSFEEDARAPKRVPGGRLDARRNSASVDALTDLDGFYFELRSGLVQDMERRRHDLRPDAVAEGDRNRCFAHGAIQGVQGKTLPSSM